MELGKKRGGRKKEGKKKWIEEEGRRKPARRVRGLHREVSKLSRTVGGQGALPTHPYNLRPTSTRSSRLSERRRVLLDPLSRARLTPASPRAPLQSFSWLSNEDERGKRRGR